MADSSSPADEVALRLARHEPLSFRGWFYPFIFLLAILTAEHLIGMIPKGTHDYNTFIKPSELGRWAREAGLELLGMEGVSYHPLTRQFSLGRDIKVNYLAAFARVEA